MSASSQASIALNELVEAAVEGTSIAEVASPQVINRVVVSTPSVLTSSPLTTSQTATTPSATGRQVLPVVYFNLPRNRVGSSGSPTAVTVVNHTNSTGGIVLNNVAQMLPQGARSGNFLPGLAQKITVNATANTAALSPTVNQVATSGNQQPHYVTIRSTSQPGSTNTSANAQPHFVTIPKESLTDSPVNVTVKTVTNQVPGQQAQYVTMVPKSSFPGTGSGGQIVTIRAPLLTGTGGQTSATQNQILTIQSPVLQPGTNQATLVPISTASSTGKSPQISYIGPVMKNGTIPNLVASSPKMVLSTVPTLQKTTLPFAAPTQTVAQSSTVSQSPSLVSVNNVPVTNIVTLSRTSGTPTITIGPPKDSTAQSSVAVLPTKETAPSNQTVTILSKDSVSGKPTFTIVPQKETVPSPANVTVLKESSAPNPSLILSKDRVTNTNPVSILSSKDVTSTAHTVTVLSAKDVPAGSPITLLSKDSLAANAFALLSKDASSTNPTMKLVSSKDTSGGNSFTIVSSKDHVPQNTGGNTFTIVSSKESNPQVPGGNTFTIVSSKDSSQQNPVSLLASNNPTPNPTVTVLASKDTTPGIPTFTFVPSKDGTTANPTVTLLSSKDLNPTYTILSNDAASNGSTVVSSKDTSNSSFTIISSQEGTGNPITIVPSKENESDSSQGSTSTQKTTLPFSLSPEMTVTTAEVSSSSHPQFQQIGKDFSTTSVGFIPISGFVEQSALEVSLPESTTLTPISEADASASTDSMIVRKEPMEIEIHTDIETKPSKKTSLLIRNNVITKQPDKTCQSEDLSKCLQETVAAICSKESDSQKQTAIINCDDEVTLIKVSSNEEPKSKFPASLDDNPDDIKIELVTCSDDSTSKDQSQMDVDEVSIKIEKKSRSPSPTGKPASTKAKPAQNSKLLPVSKSLSNIRSPSILKSHIAYRGNILPSPIIQRKPKPKPASLLQAVPKTEIKKEKEIESTPTLDDFDPIKALEWKNGIGLLPGSDLKFRVNEFGFIEMISDDDKEQEAVKSSQQSAQNSEEVDESIGSGDDEKDVKTEYFEEEDGDKVHDPEDIIRCRHCGVYGLAAEFVNQRYCNTNCQEGAALKKATEFKREQEHRAMKLRRKRRRLERISERVSVDVKKEENSDDFMEIDEDISMSVSKNNSLNPTPCASDDDNGSVTSNDGAEVSKVKGKSKPAAPFSWVKYLESVKAKGAPAKLFKDDLSYIKNKFKVGMKLEGIDPEHPAHFCVLSVAEVKGFRLRLHFDGYGDSYDFWVNSDSPEIFPVGWCLKNNRKLDPPRGYTQSFNWTTYLKNTRAFSAPRHLFTKNTASSVCPNAFRVGMKLEAVDRKDSTLICVATVADVLDNRILVHFDSWDDMYDYWVDPSSPYIHPVGWCAENKLTLTPPNEFKEPGSFSWPSYLKQTKSIPAPARAFKQRPTVGFKKGMRLEAVDKRVPQLIRVATVQEAKDHRILLHFDGWPHVYDYWVDEDSPDIHRPGWCRDTKHPLEPPISKEDLKDTSHCSTPACRGEGHIKGAKFSSHTSVQNCPYAPENLNKDGLIADRLVPKGDTAEYQEIPTPEKSTTLNNAIRLVEGRRPLGRPPKYRRIGDEDNRNKRRRVSEEDDKRSLSPLETASKLQLELHQSVFDPGYKVEVGSKSVCWAKHSLPLHSSPMLTDATDPMFWDPNEVAKFVSSVAGLEARAHKFTEEEVDGEALLLMTQQDLVDSMGLKLGPAIKLYNCIVLLRQKAG